MQNNEVSLDDLLLTRRRTMVVMMCTTGAVGGMMMAGGLELCKTLKQCRSDDRVGGHIHCVPTCNIEVQVDHENDVRLERDELGHIRIALGHEPELDSLHMRLARVCIVLRMPLHIEICSEAACERIWQIEWSFLSCWSFSMAALSSAASGASSAVRQSSI